MRAGQSDSRVAVVIKVILVELIWGGTFVGGRVVAGSLGTVDSASVRFLFGGLGILLLLFYERGWRAVQARDLSLIVLMGLVGIVAYNFFFFAGLHRIGASRASLITAGTPIGVMLGARLFLGESLDFRKVGGIVLSVAGAVIVITSRRDLGSSTGHTGEFLMLGCAASWAAYTLIARSVVARVPAMTVTGYSTLAGALVFLLLAAPQASMAKFASVSVQVWVAGAFIGLFGAALAFKWYMDGVAVLGASRTAQFNNLIPVFAVALSMIILRERPSLGSLLGGLLVIVGLMFAQSRRAQRTQPAPSHAQHSGVQPVSPVRETVSEEQ